MIRKGKSFKAGSLVIWIIISLTDIITGMVTASDAAGKYTTWYGGHSDQATQAWLEAIAPYAAAFALFTMLFVIQFGIADIITQLEIRNASAKSGSEHPQCLPKIPVPQNMNTAMPNTVEANVQPTGTWFCNQCGKQNARTNDFCIGCGKHR